MNSSKRDHGKHAITVAELRQALERGIPHTERKARLEDALLWFLQQYAVEGVRYGNSDLCRAILANAADGPAPQQLRRPLSFFISSMAKDPDYREHIRLGREVSVGNGRWVRTREWVTDGSGTPPTTTEMKAHSKASAAPVADGFEAINDHMAEHLAQPLWKVLGFPEDPGETYEVHVSVVQGVMTVKTANCTADVSALDKPDVSRHPKPGYAPVTCGECGGSGRVYMKGAK